VLDSSRQAQGFGEAAAPVGFVSRDAAPANGRWQRVIEHYTGFPRLRKGALAAAIDVVDGCAGRPAKGRRWKSVTVKE